ncbi:MAG: alkaline shock response membrane anchor protein AmaP [Dehalococcoidia bacterium]|nr:alkaline shock response membrane anchor protein AmaP [Dehalococcoidia bacterium]
MNLLNRIFMILVCLALIAGSVSVIVLAWTIPNESIDGLNDTVQWLSDNNQDLEKTFLTAGGAAIAVLALIILILELTPKGGTEVKVTDLQVGNAVLSTAAIGQRIEEAVRLVPHVADVKATVKTKGKGVAVGLDLHVDPDANLAEVTDEACAAARDVLVNRVHVGLAAPPRARLHYRELRMGRAATTRPMLLPQSAPTEPEPAVAEEEAPREPVVAAATPVTEGNGAEADSHERKQE